MNDMSPLAAFFGMNPAAWAMLAVFMSVALLTVVIAWGKVQPLIAFVLTALVAALLLGMPLANIPKAIEKGIGDLLGSLTVIIAALHGHCRGHAVAADTGSAHSGVCRDIRNQANVCDQLSYRLLGPRSQT